MKHLRKFQVKNKKTKNKKIAKNNQAKKIKNKRKFKINKLTQNRF